MWLQQEGFGDIRKEKLKKKGKINIQKPILEQYCKRVDGKISF